MDTNLIHLSVDGIREAICEVRFESQGSPEVVIGRLVDASAWSDFEQQRLASADIPEQLRTDESFRHAPSYQLNNPRDPADLIRVGPNAVSCHRFAPYPGWATFEPSIKATLHALFALLRGVKITRIGFRYVNAFSRGTHGIASAADLNVILVAGGSNVGAEFVMVYAKELAPNHRVQISIASPGFVQGPEGPDFDVLVDIDVSTPKGTELHDAETALSWIRHAHDRLKEEFFKLIPAEVVDRLRG